MSSLAKRFGRWPSLGFIEHIVQGWLAERSKAFCCQKDCMSAETGMAKCQHSNLTTVCLLLGYSIKGQSLSVEHSRSTFLWTLDSLLSQSRNISCLKQNLHKPCRSPSWPRGRRGPKGEDSHVDHPVLALKKSSWTCPSTCARILVVIREPLYFVSFWGVALWLLLTHLFRSGDEDLFWGCLSFVYASESASWTVWLAISKYQFGSLYRGTNGVIRI